MKSIWRGADWIVVVVVALGAMGAAIAAPRSDERATSERPSTSPSTRPTTKPTTRPAATQPAGRRLGILVVDLNTQHQEDQIPDFGGNLIVNEVKPGSRAERLGLRVGDAIKWINGEEMKTGRDVIDAVQSSDKLKIEVIRDHKPHTFDEHETPQPEEPRGL